jgi:hypothetical protein
VKLKGKLNKKNFIRKTWEWTHDTGAPPGPNPPKKGGGKKEVENKKNERQNGTKRGRLGFFEMIGSLIDLLLRNLATLVLGSPPAGNDLVNPSFWGAAPIDPDLESRAGDIAAPVPVYDLDSSNSETIAFTFDRYFGAVYLDTVYVAMTPNGSGWDVIAGIRVTNNTGISQSSLTYNLHAENEVLSVPAAGSPDFAFSSAVLNGSEQIDASHSGTSILNGSDAAVWASGTMADDGSFEMRDIKWGTGTSAAQAWAIYLTEDLDDMLFDVEFTYTNLYDVPVDVTGLEVIVTDTFLGADQVESWSTGWSSLGGNAALNPGESATYTIQDMRDWQSLSVRGSVESQSTRDTLEEWNHSHRDFEPTCVWTKGEVTCVNTMNKSGRGVTKNMAGVIQGCYKAFVKGGPSAETCAGTPSTPGDPKGKVQKAIDKTGTNFTKKCVELPGVGPQDPAQVNDPSIQTEFDMFDRIVGSDLDLLPADKIPFNCVSAIMKGAAKCQDAKIKEFLGCKKTLFKTNFGTGTPTCAVDIRDGCLGTGGASQPDPKGKIAKKCTNPLKAGIFKDMGKKCVDAGVDIGATFGNGECASACATGGTECSTCIERIVECEVCEWASAVDGLDRDCDEFDDGLVNSSCGGGSPSDAFLDVTSGVLD